MKTGTRFGLQWWWRQAFRAYGPLSLTSMAGMSLGGTIFVAASISSLAKNWGRLGKSALWELRPFLWPTLFLFLAAFASLLAAWIWPPAGGEVSLGLGELKKFHHFLYPPLVAAALLHSTDRPERHPFWTAWGAMGIFCGMLAVVQFFGRDLFPEPWLSHRFFRSIGETGRFHGQGIMFFHLSFASAMTFVAAAGIARLLWPLSWDVGRSRLFWGLVALAGVAGVYFSYSRTGLVTLGIVIGILGFLRKPLYGMISFLLVLFAAMVIWQQSPSLRDRFLQTSGSNFERILLWKANWEMFQDRPITGFGFSRSAAYVAEYADRIQGSKAQFTSHAHNNFLEALSSTGLLGLMALLCWNFALIYWAWQGFRGGEHRWLSGAAIASLIGFQLNGLTQVNFWDGKSQHSLMIWAGVAMALGMIERRRGRV